jgi:hypothetical protein
VAGVAHDPVAEGTACADADLCNGNETCDGSGVCVAGTPPVVDDGNPCTADSCDPATGVAHSPVSAGTSCADADLCNGEETCDGSGACVAGTPPVVDDGNPCTADRCDPTTGIVHSPVSAGTSCSDGNLCNGDETCDAAGTCAAGTPMTLDDGNPCTTDSCEPATGAVSHTPVTAGTSCADDNPCNGEETCDSAAVCMPGTPLDVDDGDPCTIDTCEPDVGPVHRSCKTPDPTVIQTTLSANEWLYTGENPIQVGVAPTTIELRRAAVLHGYVRDVQGNPLPDVSITVLDHPEFGSTISHADGRFDMAVNGGGALTVEYLREGYLEAQRTVDTPWDDHAWASDVVLIQADPAATEIDLDSTEPFQVAQGSIVTDEDGSRQATVLFPAGNTATVELPDGSTEELATLSVRATEFTVGESGPNAMPAELPPTTSYTYCVEINADEAVELGAKSVTFAEPLPFYVDNFLGFDAGTVVPMGSYDRDAAEWIPEDSGVVIDVVGVSTGLADLCVDGDGVAETAAELAAYGITDAEREQIASLYAPGQSFWRVELNHFTSPVDLNWPVPGLDPAPPPPPPPEPPRPCQSTCCNSGSGSLSGSPDGPEEKASSVLRCADQVYSEQMPVAGTPFSLFYESDRVPGYLNANKIEIPLVGPSWDPRILSVYLRIDIAGRTYQFDFIADPSLTQDRDGSPGPNRSHPVRHDRGGPRSRHRVH